MRALMAGGGAMLAATVAGVAVYVSAPAPGTTQADLVGAGLTTDYTPHRLACMVLFDGGYKEVRPLVAVANALEPDGRRATIWQRAAIPYKDALADSNSNCRDLGTLTWAVVQAEYGGASTAEDPGSCACWSPAAGACTYSGTGVDPGVGHNEFPPGTWSGPGCVARPCGEVAGRRNWPSGCPL